MPRRPSPMTLVLIALLVGSLLGAYFDQMRALQTPLKTADQMRNERIMAAVQSSLRDREDCLRRDSTDWCNRDLSIAQLEAHHSQLYDKYNFADETPNPFRGRNQWLGLGTISAGLLVLRFRYWRREKIEEASRGVRAA
jgi:hypothetical protein